MHAKVCLAIGLVVALAACGKSGGQNSSGGSTAPAGGSTAPAGGSAAVSIQPGEWEMTYETVDIDAPGMPPAYAAQMKGHKVTRRDCITPEEAARPLTKMMENKDNRCDYSGFTFGGGHIQGTISCGGGKSPGKVTMTTSGQYDGQTYAYTSNMTMTGPRGDMKVESRATGHRVGECPAGGREDGK